MEQNEKLEDVKTCVMNVLNNHQLVLIDFGLTNSVYDSYYR